MACVDPPRKKKKGRIRRRRAENPREAASLFRIAHQQPPSSPHIRFPFFPSSPRSRIPPLAPLLLPPSPPQAPFLLLLLPKLPSSSFSAASTGDGDQSEFIYFTWLRSKFDEFLKSLLNVLASPQGDDTLMEFVKVANAAPSTLLCTTSF